VVVTFTIVAWQPFGSGCFSFLQEEKKSVDVMMQIATALIMCVFLAWTQRCKFALLFEAKRKTAQSVKNGKEFNCRLCN
jgi:hypothetical protein